MCSMHPGHTRGIARSHRTQDQVLCAQVFEDGGACTLVMKQAEGVQGAYQLRGAAQPLAKPQGQEAAMFKACRCGDASFAPFLSCAKSFNIFAHRAS